MKDYQDHYRELLAADAARCRHRRALIGAHQAQKSDGKNPFTVAAKAAQTRAQAMRPVILAFLRENAMATSEQVRAHLKVSRSFTSRLLLAMQNEGRIERKGTHNLARWRAME